MINEGIDIPSLEMIHFDINNVSKIKIIQTQVRKLRKTTQGKKLKKIIWKMEG